MLGRLALLFVIALDVLGQGLVIPVLTTVLLDPGQTFLPTDTSVAKRQMYFGVTMGAFFFAWFLGAAYISKLSDFIGRKLGVLICLTGALTGYLLTVVSLFTTGFWLLVVARAITGFTAGNQPIAQAALIDASGNEQEKARFMGHVVVAISLGLVGGPLLSGLLSSKSLIGHFASLKLPFYAGGLLVVLSIAMVVAFFHEPQFERRKVRVRPTDVFLTLWHASQRPVVLRLSLVFFCSQLALMAFFVFIDDFLKSRFHFETLQNSIVLVVFGVAIAVSGAFFVPPLAKRFSKKRIIYGTLLTMVLGLVVFTWNPVANLSYVLLIPFVVGWAVNYPIMLTLFSASVAEAEQGWVMGVTVALYTLGATIISFVGGSLMAINIRLPFGVAMGAVVLAAILIVTLWRGQAFLDLDPDQR